MKTPFPCACLPCFQGLLIIYCVFMKRQITLTLLALMFVSCLSAMAQANRPFCGAWTDESPDGYYHLVMDLYGKNLKLPDGIGSCYGYLQMENDFVGDYWIITGVEGMSGNACKVKYYSLRYGAPGEIETADVAWNPSDRSIRFGEGYTFPAAHACKHVRISKSNVNIRTAPVSGAPIMKAQQGKTFALDGIVDGWYKVRLDDGRTGYVACQMAEAVK